MCLSIAGRITATSGDGIERRATVLVGAEQREVSLAMLPDAGLGDWVIFHSGYALRVISDEEAASSVLPQQGGGGSGAR
jgi:hydrogenase expression/formation protein HypC